MALLGLYGNWSSNLIIQQNKIEKENKTKLPYVLHTHIYVCCLGTRGLIIIEIKIRVPRKHNDNDMVGTRERERVNGFTALKDCF